MSGITDIVDVQITRESARLVTQGFGIPLLLAVHDQPEETFQIRSALDARNKYGANHAITTMARQFFGQEGAPSYVVVSKVENEAEYEDDKMVVTATVGGTVAEDDIFTLRINRTVITYVAQDGDGTTDVATALGGLITASGSLQTAVEVTVTGSDIEISPVGNLKAFSIWAGANGDGTLNITLDEVFSQTANLVVGATVNEGARYTVIINDKEISYTALEDDTAGNVVANIVQQISLDATLAREIVAFGVGGALKILAYDGNRAFSIDTALVESVEGGETLSLATEAGSIVLNFPESLNTAIESDGTWYGVAEQFVGTSAERDANSLLIAAAVQGLGTKYPRFYITTTSSIDSANTAKDIDGQDFGNKVSASAYSRTFWLYNRLAGFGLGKSLMGLMFSKEPGAATWKFKRLSGPVPTKLTSNQKTNLDAKFGNYFESLAGNNLIASDARTASGEYADVIIAIDFLTARLSEAVFGLLISVDKVPYTDAGITAIENQVRSVLERYPDLVDPDSIVVTAPRVVDTDPQDRANRILNSVVFSARLTGALHSVVINGSLAD